MLNIVDEIFAGADRSAIALSAGALRLSFGELEALAGAAATQLGSLGSGIL